MNVGQEFNDLFMKDADTINASLLNAPSTILDWIQENFTPKVSRVDAEVKGQTANKIYTEYLDVIDIKPELIENLEKRIWLHIKDSQYIFMGNWSMPIAQRGKYLFNIKDDSRLSS